MTGLLVSVIIPTYNREDLIWNTVNSILQQSYKDIEVIVVSDGGTDRTGIILDRIEDNRLRFIRLPNNSGLPAAARNAGIKVAKGTFIAFCDDDDLWLEGKLDAQLKEFCRDRSLLGVATNTILYPCRNLNSFFLTKNICISYLDLLSYKGCPICTSTVLLRKTALEEIGLFDESHEIRGYEDFDLWLRLLKHRDCSIKILKKAWIRYRVNNIKLTLSEGFEILNQIRSLKYIYEKHLPSSQCLLEVISNYDRYSKVYHAVRTSMKLSFGILSLADIIRDRKITLLRKLDIIMKYYLKRAYFYYFSLLEGKRGILDR